MHAISAQQCLLATMISVCVQKTGAITKGLMAKYAAKAAGMTFSNTH